MITFNMPSGISHVWNGSHAVNVYLHGTKVDAWILYPSDGRKPTQLEILACILDREAMSTDHPLVRCQWCGTACPSATEYDTVTCAHCLDASNTTGETFTATRRDGTTYQVRALTPRFWGPFGETVTCVVLTGEWSGRVLDIQTSDLIATS